MPFLILIYVSTLKFAVIKRLLSENVLQVPYAACNKRDAFIQTCSNNKGYDFDSHATKPMKGPTKCE